MKTVLYGLSLLVSSSAAAHAQIIPRWWAEAALGLGPHTDRVGTVYYIGDNAGMLRLGLGLRIGGSARTAPYVKAEYSPNPVSGHNLACHQAPNGTCYQHFPDIRGGSASVGIRHALHSRLLLGAGLGAGDYEHGVTAFADADATFRVASHFGITIGARYLRWSQGGHPFWFAPISGGFQIF